MSGIQRFCTTTFQDYVISEFTTFQEWPADLSIPETDEEALAAGGSSEGADVADGRRQEPLSFTHPATQQQALQALLLGNVERGVPING